MARRTRQSQGEQEDLLKPHVQTAPCVLEIRRAVETWRRSKYKGATDTTKTLFNHWFDTDHRLPNGRSFRYYYAQREALETLVWLYEVEQVRRHRDLVERFAKVPGIHVLQYDDFARYAIKMATGSGKTKVMALTVAWQYFNAVAEGRDDYAKTFLVVAPNVIVFERLRSDFGGGRIFRSDPIIPPELRIFWEMDFYMRGDPERASSQGALYLTNIQQFYERGGDEDSEEPEVMTDVLGPIPGASTTAIEDFDERIAARGVPTFVINDEGHHVHDEDSEWSKIIRRLNEESPAGVLGQLDFSATPRYQKGGLFTWTVFDYPLKQAIIDRVVKQPMKGVTAGLDEARSDVASVKYQGYLTAGVERWREYRDQLKPLGKKPVLFVMMNSTAEADDVGDYLRVKYPSEFGASDLGAAQLLVIHTDRSGDVSKKDLDTARNVARRVDEGESPVNAIVSVLMLREGWDVQNVTVIVGLRPYTAKANILPEQTIGRGLRLMFGDRSSTYIERVDVIGNPAFLKFVEQLEKDEDITLDTFDLKEPVVITTIEPDQDKIGHDITVPVLSPILARKKTLAEEIAGIDVSKLTCPRLPKTEGDKAAAQFHYEAMDIITLQKLVERDYTIPQPQTAEEVISYYAKRIAQDVKLPSQFAALVPKVQEFLRERVFGEPVDLTDMVIIRAIATSVAQYVTVKTFASVLRALVVEELSPILENPGRQLSETEPFPFSRPTFEASKTVFNLVAPDNDFEREFAQFLQDATDVRSFAKLPRRFGFTIEYTDSATNLRYYEPDFVAVDQDGRHYVIETKGQENIDVAYKDRAAAIWCENATLLTNITGSYVKVPQKDFGELQPTVFSDAAVVFGSYDGGSL
ncbi:MAG: DEAD/DEAH box helicase family protein [Candidatus Marsarchaeota archaeon]|nr:DEAD/DEAH box helicase family protein [Candidatus Marsarchaeota archaeon]